MYTNDQKYGYNPKNEANYFVTSPHIQNCFNLITSIDLWHSI